MHVYCANALLDYLFQTEGKCMYVNVRIWVKSEAVFPTSLSEQSEDYEVVITSGKEDGILLL